MNTALYLQVISILITLVAFVYVRRLAGRIDDLSDSVDQLWDHVRRTSPGPG